MYRVAIVTDSISCLPRELAEQYKITIVPLSFYFGNKVYRDWVDITPSQAYELFKKDPESFKTSAISPGQFLAVYREVSKESADILCVTLSSKISASYTSAMEASKQFKEENPKATIEVLDSFTVAPAEGFTALAGARAAMEGKNLATVTEAAVDMKNRVKIFIFLETIRHAYRSGRVPKIAAQVGSMLNIKPVLTVSSGMIHFVGLARNHKAGVEWLLRAIRDRAGNHPVHVAVTHAYALDEAEKLKAQIAREFNCLELWLSEFSPLMGYATGTGTLGVAFYTEE